MAGLHRHHHRRSWPAGADHRGRRRRRAPRRADRPPPRRPRHRDRQYGQAEWLHGLGAEEAIDYRDADAVAALAGTVDVALSLAAGSRETALRAVRAGGTFIALGGGAGDLDAQAEQAGIRFAATHVHTQRDWLESVVDLAGQGIITPTVSEVFDLADAAAAHRAVEAGHSTGKIVLRTTIQN